MRIVCDENIPLAKELFGQHGEIILVDGRTLSRQQLRDTGAEALIVRSVTKVNAALVDDTSVQFVGSCTIGVDHLDQAHLKARSIRVCHAPGCNAQSVVEYVVSSLATLNAFDQIKTCGVIGCGNVGSAVARELQRWGVKVCTYDPFLSEDPCRPHDIEFVALSEAMQCDVISVHTPLTKTGVYPTSRMIDINELALLTSNAIVISAGRGGVIVEDDMLRLARERKDIRWIMDVWENEPSIHFDTTAIAEIATPHIAGYSLEGKQNGSWQVYQKFCEHFNVAQQERPVNESIIEIDLASYLDDCDGGVINQNHLLTVLALQVYDPRQDHLAMNRAFAQSDASGQWFDQLRKNYPARRERSAYRFVTSKLKAVPEINTASAEVFDRCRHLGFEILV